MQQEARDICTAPAGKYRIVQVDPRDHWPTPEKDLNTLDDVRRALGNLITPHREVMQVYDDKGKRVTL